jgi:aspartyl/asparaginyl beta-hydroxylase (cupin superfamily)
MRSDPLAPLRCRPVSIVEICQLDIEPQGILQAAIQGASHFRLSLAVANAFFTNLWMSTLTTWAEQAAP